MTLDWIDAAAIWLPENKHRLGYLLMDPIENSPAFTHAMLGFPLNKFVFWERSNLRQVFGWALAHGTWDSRSWTILRGDEFCFETFLQGLDPIENHLFEYVREDERRYYVRLLGVNPVPFAYYYEITKDAYSARSKDFSNFSIPAPFNIEDFEQKRVQDWIRFQGYPAGDPASSIFPKLEGMWIVCDGQIVASVHDGLSMLPFKIPDAAINGVKVVEHDRGKGLCAALLNAFLGRLFSSGKQRAGLFVDVHNEPAMHCYERVGLVKKQLYYKVELDAAKSSS
ncbi:MAG: GNAT family N-acetyltransferase [Candidatus Sigynarchaeota archaeon]